MRANIQSYQNHPHAPTASNTQTPKDKTGKTCLNINKVYWLRSTSGLAMTVSDKSRVFAGVQESNLVLNTLASGAQTRSALGAMLWVMHWVLALTLGCGFERFKTPDMFRAISEPTHGRYQRLKAHMARRKSVPVVRRTSRLFRILSLRMRPNQYREFLARMSLSGRVRVYCL